MYLLVSLGNRKKLMFGQRRCVFWQPVIEHVFPLRPHNGEAVSSKLAMLKRRLPRMNF